MNIIRNEIDDAILATRIWWRNLKGPLEWKIFVIIVGSGVTTFLTVMWCGIIRAIAAFALSQHESHDWSSTKPFLGVSQETWGLMGIFIAPVLGGVIAYGLFWLFFEERIRKARKKLN